MRSIAAPHTRSFPQPTAFFALYPPRGIAGLIDRMFTAGELAGSLIQRERRHISLNNLGGDPPYTSSFIARACDAASQVRAPPFVVALNQVISFQTRTPAKPRVLIGEDGVIGVLMLHHAIHEVLANEGLARGRERNITPHLTLSWEEGSGPRKVIEPVRWRVSEFHLILSVPGVGHEVLGCWPLRDDASFVTAEATESTYAPGR
jgi:RNA 2',3'-cyclic 3'-phosphodiesterase